MSKCDISIEQLAAERAYRPGDTIACRVRVSVDADCTCRGLRVMLRWETHGKGNVAEGVAHEELLFVGEWRAGRSYEYELSIPAPEGPFTYRGTILNVDWAIVVTADLPWAIDPTKGNDPPPPRRPRARGHRRDHHVAAGRGWRLLVLADRRGQHVHLARLGRHFELARSSRRGVEARAGFGAGHPVAGGRALAVRRDRSQAGRRGAGGRDGSSSLEASLEIPPEAPFAFAGMSNALLWTLKIEIDDGGSAHWEKTLVLWARPGPPATATPYR